jgi:tellurite resistance-related uncharacterized protein
VLASVVLPDDVSLVRSTPVFSAADLPSGLLAAHHLAPGAWGRLRVLRGHVVFVAEERDERRTLAAGDDQVIEPEVRHHVEPSDDAELVIDFYRAAR